MKFLIGLFILLVSLSALSIDQPVSLEAGNTVLLDQEINPSTVDTFVNAMLFKRALLPQNRQLYIVIVSPGGQIDEGAKLAKVISGMPNTSVICKYCASAAGMLFATFPGPRLAIKKSDLIMHEAFLDHFTAADAKSESAISEFIETSNALDSIMAKVIGIPVKDYQSKIRNTQWEAQGADLVKLHLADKLVHIECDPYIKHLAPETCSE